MLRCPAALLVLLVSACAAPPGDGSEPPADASVELLVESDAGRSSASAAGDECEPASRAPEVGADSFCPSIHQWVGAEPSSVRRHYMLGQCARWTVCPVAYVAGGACYHCADLGPSPHRR
jgi:hypothetical protein